MKAILFALVLPVVAWPIAATAVGGSTSFGGPGPKFTITCNSVGCQCSGAAAGYADQAVTICSAIISDPQAGPQQRGDAFVARAMARILQRRYDDAIADSTQGIAIDFKLNDQTAMAGAYLQRANSYLQAKDDVDADDDYSAAIAAESQNLKLRTARGNAYMLQGKTVLALADFQTDIDKAGPQKIPMGGGITMNITYTGADGYWGRGAVYFLAGQYDQAVRDFAQTVSLEPDNALATIWLHYARLGQGGDDRAELAANAARLDLDKGEGRIVKLLLGKASPQDLPHAADGAGIMTDTACEATLAIAQWDDFAQHDGVAAKANYQTVASSCPRSLNVAVAQMMLQKIPTNLPH
jgi:tetratricopeptide (TPR) repeat protein